MSDALEDAALLLHGHPDYRVLKRLDPSSVGGKALFGDGIRVAAIIDTETTGMDPTTDKVIELGILVFQYAAQSGEVGSILRQFNALEDPGFPIPPEATAIHHITDAMVKGHRFDAAQIGTVLEGVSLVIAHNARFDRPFLERRFDLFTSLPWGCSYQDVPWREFGYGSASLEFLAYRAGLFYDGHRALTDCFAVLAVLERAVEQTGTSALRTLLENARKPSCKVYALNSAFETKDALKERGYRWDGERKVWALELKASDTVAECEWLKQNVYSGKSAEVEVETLDAKVRYSEREGEKIRVRL